ncbi:hypothetical protein [Salmonella phage SUT_S820]|uniref:Uncharacterized protein n=1 Tax=Salmonella phage SUT_S720 TaxID=3070618 RepID=A0AA51GJI8_9CAUD|nr:hypothetical protein [Salmonella phage SUT_S720]WMI36903.1 hypothetical protein [Salmonella phage SUT_S820]WMI37024.1 hypothetical protein [Salmonella phage SUT_S920]
MNKLYSLWGRMGKDSDWNLLKTNVKSNEIAYYKIHYYKTFRELEYREQQTGEVLCGKQ